jgi:hypothetical protein
MDKEKPLTVEEYKKILYERLRRLGEMERIE